MAKMLSIFVHLLTTYVSSHEKNLFASFTLLLTVAFALLVSQFFGKKNLTRRVNYQMKISKESNIGKATK
jgi:hypothetical protein